MASLAEQIEAVLKVSPGGKTTGDISRLVKSTGAAHLHNNMVMQALHTLRKNGKVTSQNGIWNLTNAPVVPPVAPPEKKRKYRSIDDE